MSATPTLYTYEYSDYVREYVPREAKHDQLIAAMPTCGTCKHWLTKDEQAKEAPCAILKFYAGENVVNTAVDFGCKRHIEDTRR